MLQQAEAAVQAAAVGDPKQGTTLRKRARLFARAMQKLGGRFRNGVQFNTLPPGTSGVSRAADGTLVLDMPQVLANAPVTSVREARDWIRERVGGGKSTGAAPSQGRPSSSPRESKGGKKAQKNSQAAASSGGPASGSSQLSPPTQAQRWTERAELNPRIPEGRNWLTRLLAKWRPKNAHEEMVKKGVTLIDIAADVDYDQFDEKFKELQYTDQPKPNSPTNMGYYKAPVAGPARFHVKPDGDHPLITSIHEVAHHLGEMLGKAAERAVKAAHKGTLRYKTMMDRSNKNSLAYKEPGHCAYLNRPSEVFARAFAQLIVEEIGNITDADGHLIDPELAVQFKEMAKDPDYRDETWSPQDFAGVRDTLVKELEKVGWKLRSRRPDGH